MAEKERKQGCKLRVEEIKGASCKMVCIEEKNQGAGRLIRNEEID